MGELPRGVLSEGEADGVIRHYTCRHCGRDNEIRWRGYVPAAFYNVLLEYVRDAAGDEFVLLPVATLNALGEELDAFRAAKVSGGTPTKEEQ